MFERLMMRLESMAERAVRRRRGEVAAALAEAAPAGVEIIEEEECIVLAGHGLERRFALDPELRWFVVRHARDGLGRQP